MALKMSFTKTRPLNVLLLLLLLGLSTVLPETHAACSTPPNFALCSAATVADVMPSAACCQGLKAYIAASGAACLCQAANDPQFAKSGAKLQYAIKLPQKCNVMFKAGSVVCNGQVIPGGQ